VWAFLILAFAIPIRSLAAHAVDEKRAGGVWELRRDAFVEERPESSGGVVELVIGDAGLRFPQYFNQLGVKTIRVRFAGEGGVSRRVSILWNGGSQGRDRFAVSVDGIDAGTSRLFDSERRPYTWNRDDFLVRLGDRKEHMLEIRSLPDHPSEIEFAGIRMAASAGTQKRPVVGT